MRRLIKIKYCCSELWDLSSDIPAFNSRPTPSCLQLNADPGNLVMIWMEAALVTFRFEFDFTRTRRQVSRTIYCLVEVCTINNSMSKPISSNMTTTWRKRLLGCVGVGRIWKMLIWGSHGQCQRGPSGRLMRWRSRREKGLELVEWWELCEHTNTFRCTKLRLQLARRRTRNEKRKRAH